MRPVSGILGSPLNRTLYNVVTRSSSDAQYCNIVAYHIYIYIYIYRVIVFHAGRNRGNGQSLFVMSGYHSDCCCWKTFARGLVPALIPFVAFWCLYRYFARRYKHWENLGVPHTEPVPLLGHFADPTLGRRSATLTIDSLYKRFDGHRYFGMYQLRHPLLVLRDPELINAVLTSDFGSFHDRLPSRKSFECDRLFENMVNLTGDRWKSVRAKLSPTFTVAKLKAMFGDLYACTDQLVDKLSQLTPDGQGKHVEKTPADT